MSEVKIFVDAHVFDNEHQGSRTYLREIYSKLILKKDLRFFFAAHDIENLASIFGHHQNVEYLKLRFKSSHARLLFEIPLIITKLKPDFAHFQYMVPPFKCCKYIVTTHDVLFLDFPADFPSSYRKVRKFLYGFGVKQADLLTTVSNYSKDAIIRHFGVDPELVHVTPNGISMAFFASYDVESSVKYIREKYRITNYLLFVGRIEPRKQQSMILNIFFKNKLYEQGISLIFIGHRSLDDPQIDSSIESLNATAKHHVHFFSKISDSDLIKFYQASKGVIYPSKAEGFGIPPLEAAALQIPVLCSDATAMADYSFFGHMHVDPWDYEAVEAGVLKMVGEERNVNELSEISNLIREKYSWDSPAEILYNLIKNF